MTAEEKVKTLVEVLRVPNFLYVGRGPSYPIALEGTKAKEISYIHAEGYALELKHGPIALVDKHMPIVAYS